VTAEQQETIARQLETERALAASEERLRLALAAGRTATYEMDLLTDRVVWSPGVGAMFGLGRDAVPSGLADSVRLIDERDRALVQRTVGAARKEASHGTIELRAIGADAVSRWLMLTWLSRADDDGVIRRLVGTLTDISERKALEEQFLHAQKMQAMGSLAGGIAHDFNNLLTVILGAAQIARASLEGTDAPETLRTDIEEVLAAGDRAAMLTGQLLAFSRRQVVQPRHFDGCDLVGGMGTMLRRLVGEQIRVETALPGSTVPLFADHGQLTQVLMNLAVNARDAMPEGGTLRINLRIDGAPSGSPLPDETLRGERFAVLSVSDSGTGIDPSVLPLIFDPFFTTKPVGQGTGLGLSTVYGIVTQLGGTVRVASTVGRGTTFDVYLPLAVGSVESVEAVVAAPASFEEQPRTILLAEDEQGLRRVAARVLRAAGFSVILAENGEEALTAAAAHAGAIDLLVSDVVMPRLGGLDLASLLLRERPATRVLFMSGYPQDAGHGTPVSLANAAFLAKPFKPSDLVAAVRRALAEA
jgi:PAS domain S-box-containing protein